MRRWLPIVLLLAAAALVALFVLRGAAPPPAIHAEQREQADSPRPAENVAAEPASQAQGEAPRELVAAPAPAPQDQAPAAEPKEGEATLLLHVLGKVDRAPLAGVRAYLHPQKLESGWSSTHLAQAKGNMHESPISGSEGVLEFAVPAGVDLILNASAEDRSAGRTEQKIAALLPGERRELQIELPQGDDAHVFGKVIAAESGAPIAGARVALIEADESYSSNEGSTWTKHDLAQATTGPEGAFEFRFPSWRRAHLRVEAEGYGLRLAAPRRDEKAAEEPLIVKLSRAGTLDAHVLDGSGKGIGGASVLLNAHGYALDRSEEEQGFFSGEIFSLPDEQWKAETGADGSARIEGLPAGVGFVLEVRQQGKVLHHEAEELKLAPGETREIEWRIGSGTRLSGQVLDQDGKPVKGQAIWLEKSLYEMPFYFQLYEDERIVKRARTDDEGRFVIEDVPAGQWWIGPAAERQDWDAPKPDAVAARAEVLTTSGEPSRELTLHVFRGLYIRGKVVDPSGAAVKESFVHGESEGSMIWAATRSGADGAFAFGPIADGSFTLTADSADSFAASEPVSARAGDTGVVLQLKPGATIRGRVIDAATGASCSAELMFTPEQPRPGMFGSGMSTSTEADGTFKHEGFDPGRYGISAMTADGRFAQQAGIDVGAGAESGEIVLAVKPGGKLRLTYKGTKPQLFFVIRANGVPTGFGDGAQPGKPRELLVPAGALVLELRSEWDGPPRTKPLEIKAGETKDIELTDEN